MKTCEECGRTDETVRERECGYAAEIDGTVVVEMICEECEFQHCQDI